MDNDLSIEGAAGSVTLTGYGTKVETVEEQQSYLDFDGYLKLMVAQMSNQDFNNPMEDSEFIQQMASYSMMETINKMNEQSHISYASSLVGKAVTVSDGENNLDTGLVDSVIISDGKYQLLVNGTKYDSDSVTDIVDPTTYNTLYKLVGFSATATDEEGNSVHGKITNILIKDGKGYAVINGTLQPFDSLEFDQINPDGTPVGGDGTENTEGTQGEGGTTTEGAENSGQTGTDTNTDTETGTGTEAADNASRSAEVNASGASMFLGDQGTEVTARANEYARQKLSEYYGNLDQDGNGESDFNVVYKDENSAIIEAVRSSSVARERAVMNSDGYYATKVENVASSFSARTDPGEEEGTVVRASTAKSSGNNLDDEDIFLSDEDDDEFFDEDTLIDDEELFTESEDFFSETEEANAAANAKVTAPMTSSYADRSNAEAYKEDPGVEIGDGLVDGKNSSYAQWPPSNRAFQYLYPAEAALANEYGTKMFDIRFIHNTDINSVINTDLILGSSISGKYFTDLGYSGKGSLGEVVTWADGTQRVEVIGSHGSTWFTTSGNYTLDQICDFSGEFTLADKLTPFERAIRAASREYTPAETAKLENDRQFYLRMAAYNNTYNY